MPFDTTFGRDTDPALWSRPFIETAGSEFVPDIGHIAPDLVLLGDGSVLAMSAVPGYPFELASMRERNIHRRQLNDLFRSVADDNVTLAIHLVHHNHVPRFQFGEFRSRFAQELLAKYSRNALEGRLVANDWFISIVVAPRFSPGRALRRRLASSLGRRRAVEAGESVTRHINSVMLGLMAYLGPDGARRLGLRHDDGGYLYSEIAEARRLILTARWQAVPLTTGLLSAAIYTDRVTCGTRLVRIDSVEGPRFAKTLALRDYPAETRTGQFSHFTKLPEQFPFVLSQTFRFQGREEAATRLYLKRTRMENAWSIEKRGMEGLDDAREDVVSGETVRGHHNFALTVFGDTPDAVRKAASAAASAMTRAGAVPIAEDGGAFAAYWSMLPGQPEWLEGRSGSMSSRNLTAFAPLEGFSAGSKTGFWGAALVRFPTSGGTAFDFVPHVDDVGHALFLGRTGSGKTLMLTMMICALEQATSGGRGTVIFFDKDRGAEPVIWATGGTYLSLRAGEASGLAPLRGLTNTPANRAFLEEWIAKLIQQDERGPLQTESVERLRRAVGRQMRLPAPERSLGAVRAFLGFGKGTDGERLEQWCRGGALGWLFDGERDEVRLNAPLVGFDMTQLLQHSACPLVGAYLVHRIGELIDGRRLAVICDECRFYLLSPLFAAMIEDFALTLRKKNGMLWLAAQQPEHITESAVGASLASQAQTVFAFPSRDADPAQFIDQLGFTRPMYRALTEEMPTLSYRSVMMKRDSGSAILRVELTDMADEIAILSGREETTRLIPAIRALVGNDPDAFTTEFVRRVHAIRKGAA